MSNQVKIDARRFSKHLDNVVRRSSQGKQIKDIAKKAAQPWKEAARSGVYPKVKKRTGGLKRSITVRQLKKSLGVVAGVNFNSRGGWKAHFFRKGGRFGRIDWQALYSRKTPQVKRKFNEGLINHVLRNKK